MIICTSICSNYIPKALTLAKSIREHEPNAKFIICLVERSAPDLGEHKHLVDEIILAKDIGIEDFDSFIFRHRIVEASTAVKGHLFVHLLKRFGQEQDFVYIDPDCMLFSPLEELHETLKTNEIVLTPHLLSSGNIDMEISSLKHGVFNLGFLAFRRSPAAESLINWWAERLFRFCYEDFERGLFTDQKWFNLAPCFYDIHILRHPGYNFATWSFMERRLSEAQEQFSVDETFPLRFVHFSGFDKGTFDVCNERWADPSRQPTGKKLADVYRRELAEFEKTGFTKTPWSYSSYLNGEAIADPTRIFFRTLGLGPTFDPFSQQEALVSLHRKSLLPPPKPKRTVRSVLKRVKNILKSQTKNLFLGERAVSH